jgi:hypothetical protein
MKGGSNMPPPRKVIITIVAMSNLKPEEAEVAVRKILEDAVGFEVKKVSAKGSPYLEPKTG